MSIATEGMIVNLHMGAWDGYKFDKGESRELAARKGTADGVLRVNKLIVDDGIFKETKAARSAIYDHFIKHTLPWKDNGDRLLMRKMYFEFIERHEGLVGEFEAAVDHLVRVKYPSARDQAAFRMAATFKPEDYPRPEELHQRFYVKLDIDAVTEAGDFRCMLNDKTTQEIRRQMEEAMAERLSAAQAHVWQKVSAAVEHYHNRMAATDGRLFDSVKDNLFDLIDVLPGLNVLGDPALDKLGIDIKRRLQDFDIGAMRKDKPLRAKARDQAADLVAKMREHMKTLVLDAEDEE